MEAGLGDRVSGLGLGFGVQGSGRVSSLLRVRVRVSG